MLPGFAIRMHMHAVVKSALHNRFYLCMRLGIKLVRFDGPVLWRIEY